MNAIVSTVNAVTMTSREIAELTGKAPRKTKHSRAPKDGNVHLALDRNGRRTVSLERRPSGITIENREQRLASEAKTARIAGGVLK